MILAIQAQVELDLALVGLLFYSAFATALLTSCSGVNNIVNKAVMYQGDQGKPLIRQTSTQAPQGDECQYNLSIVSTYVPRAYLLFYSMFNEMRWALLQYQ